MSAVVDVTFQVYQFLRFEPLFMWNVGFSVPLSKEDGTREMDQIMSRVDDQVSFSDYLIKACSADLSQEEIGLLASFLRSIL